MMLGQSFHSKIWKDVRCEKFLNEGEEKSQIVFKLSELIRQCWEKLPGDRPSVDEILHNLETLERELK